ncbi:MAG TPA: TIGR00725 family protein [Candidatus Woesearchaeota archaeon]|nr:TIGR00725 family protein [Candidatus Woesearchaeota archaeon]
MGRRLQIAVIGSSKSICTKKAYRLAEKVGEEIAKIGAVTVTGGGHGVMEAAMKGAKKHGGLTLGILPWEKMENHNKYCDALVATGIGWSRDAINLNSCDGAIIVGGGAGTLNEATYAYIEDIPIVALTTSGGMAKTLTGIYFDERKTEKILGAKTPKEAVRKLLEEIEKKRKKSKRPGLIQRKRDY